MCVCVYVCIYVRMYVRMYACVCVCVCVCVCQPEDSSRLLQNTQSEHRTLAGAVASAKSIIGQIFQHDFTDKLLIGFAMIVFLLVILNIIKSRLFPNFAFSIPYSPSSPLDKEL